ncbi:MAG: DUF1631 family protein [Burkholderiaceae bacterium]
MSKRIANSVSISRRSEILQSLIPVAAGEANGQLDAFTIRITDALFALSEQNSDPKFANIAFNSANLLKKNAYPFYYIASSRIEEALRNEILACEKSTLSAKIKNEEGLSLVSFEEMDNKVAFGNLCRPLEEANANLYTSLGVRLGALFNSEEQLSIPQNPFRPEVFLNAITASWCEFSPDPETHSIILPLLTPENFIDLSPVLQAMNEALIGRGIQTELSDSYRIKKSNTTQEATKKAAVNEQLKRLFGSETAADADAVAAGAAMVGGVMGGGVMGGAAGGLPAQFLQATAASSQLMGFLAGMQKSIFDMPLDAGAIGNSLTTAALTSIKNQAPQGTLRKVDEQTIDLLTKIFEIVFRDQNIPTEVKSLIGLLQVPVLKASLIDKDFFFKDDHPARRLIDLLSKSSLGWDQNKGIDDPLYQTMKRNVARVQKDYDQEVSVFSDVVSDLEAYINKEESVATESLATPITNALKQEKIIVATKSAKTDVAMRVGTGEVVAFVETFLESKWVSVLTIAYSVKDEKPQALDSAIKTMDDLIWSVKPKITPEQRKELVAKLPGLLATLNKWLNIVKLDDAERLKFFAELAECHASIVRAPIEMSPQRQLELSMEAAKKAAERRLEIRAKQKPEVEQDEYADTVEKLERGMWLEFTPKDAAAAKYKLAWVSPMRNLYIFTTGDKQESFSMSAEKLAETFRNNGARHVLLSGVVNRALEEALGTEGANDAEMETKTAA